jgi:hypothetical protein
MYDNFSSFNLFKLFTVVSSSPLLGGSTMIAVGTTSLSSNSLKACSQSP